jgi:hypothetical protein
MTPYVAQGTLNRLYATIVPTNSDLVAKGLKVTPGYLGADGIRMTFDDTATDLLPTMTGMVTSPRPYQGITLTIALVKTTSVAAVYMAQFLDNTYIGQVIVVPDVAPQSGTNGAAAGLTTFMLYNMTLETIREMMFNGTEPVVVVTMRGYRYVNDNAFGDSGLAFQSPGVVAA